MKKNLAIVVIVIFVLGLIVGGVLILGKKSPSGESPSIAKKEGVLIETPLEERPYVALIPRTDGKEFTLEISRIKPETETIEYELVYLSNGLSRGVVGSVSLDGEKQISRKLLLGTCSGSVCKYDEGVEEGTLTLRFRESGGTRKLVADFHLQEAAEQLTSADGKFEFNGNFPVGVFYITMSTIGLPADLDGEIAAGPYGVFTSGRETVKDGVVSLEITEEKIKLYSWTGKAWEEMKEAEREGQTISAPISQLATFAAIVPRASED
jgi:hypothetical protein